MSSMQAFFTDLTKASSAREEKDQNSIGKICTSMAYATDSYIQSLVQLTKASRAEVATAGIELAWQPWWDASS